MRHLARFLFWLVPFGLVMIWVAWLWALPWLASRVLAGELAGQGITLDQVEWERIGCFDTALRLLVLQHEASGVSLRAEHILLRYQLSDLLQGDFSTLRADIGILQAQISDAQNAGGQSLQLVSPLPLLALLPLANLRIDRMAIGKVHSYWQGRAMLHAGVLRLRLHEREHDQRQLWLNVQQHGEISAALQDQQRILAQLQGRLVEQPSWLQLQARIHGQLAGLALFADHLQAEGEFSGHLKLAGPTGEYADIGALSDELKARLEMQVHGRLQQAGRELDGSLAAELEWQRHTLHWRILPESRVKLVASQWSAQLQAEQLSGSLSIEHGQLKRLGLDGGTRLRMESLQAGEMRLSQMKVHHALPLSYQLASKQLSALDLELQPASFRWHDMHIHPGSLRLQSAPWRLNQSPDLTLDAADLGFSHPRLQLPARRWHVQLSGGKQWHLAASYHFQRQHPWQLEADFSPRGNRLQAALDLALDAPLQELAALSSDVVPLLQSVTLSDGTLRAHAQLQLSPVELALTGTLKLQDWQGTVKKLPFQGLQGDVQWRYRDGALEISDMNWRLDRLDAGLPLDDWQLAGHARMGDTLELHLQSCRLHVLGGSVELGRAQLERDRQGRLSSPPFTLKLRNISVQQLLELEKQQGIEATGIVDGELPARWLSGKGLRIKQGSLKVRQPGGIIRYTGTAASRAMAAQNPGVGLAMQVLGNFHYQRLDADVDYQPNGRLQLGLHLAGHNPDYDQGRPVHFNLNVEENVLTLLKSLSLSDEISEQLQRRSR